MSVNFTIYASHAVLLISEQCMKGIALIVCAVLLSNVIMTPHLSQEVRYQKTLIHTGTSRQNCNKFQTQHSI